MSGLVDDPGARSRTYIHEVDYGGSVPPWVYMAALACSACLLSRRFSDSTAVDDYQAMRIACVVSQSEGELLPRVCVYVRMVSRCTSRM